MFANALINIAARVWVRIAAGYVCTCLMVKSTTIMTCSCVLCVLVHLLELITVSDRCLLILINDALLYFGLGTCMLGCANFMHGRARCVWNIKSFRLPYDWLRCLIMRTCQAMSYRCNCARITSFDSRNKNVWCTNSEFFHDLQISMNLCVIRIKRFRGELIQHLRKSDIWLLDCVWIGKYNRRLQLSEYSLTGDWQGAQYVNVFIHLLELINYI